MEVNIKMLELKIMFLFGGGATTFLVSVIILIVMKLAMAEYDKTSKAMAWIACGPPALFGISLIAFSALTALTGS
jgi:hypothetical protein